MPSPGDSLDVADVLGVQPDMRVLVEVGWDDDGDDAIRDAIEERCGSRLIDPDDAAQPADVALLWWRNGDGDLADYLVDAHDSLGDQGLFWVLTPRAGVPGYVDPAEIVLDASPTGLILEKTAVVNGSWSGTCFRRHR